MLIILLLLKVVSLTKSEKRNLKFNHKNFSKFRDKIIYLVYEEEPDQIEKLIEMTRKMKNQENI